MKLPYIALAVVSGFILLLLIGWTLFSDTSREEKFSFEPAPQNNEEINIVPKNSEVLHESENKPSDIRAGATIDLHGQHLSLVPMYVFQKLGIEKLDLSNNMLSGSLQAEVRHLSDLKVLDLSDNNFTGLPAEVGQLSKLEVLDVSNNALTGLPYEIGSLQNLKVLDLRGNEYSKADLEKIKETLPSTVTILID